MVVFEKFLRHIIPVVLLRNLNGSERVKTLTWTLKLRENVKIQLFFFFSIPNIKFLIENWKHKPQPAGH